MLRELYQDRVAEQAQAEVSEPVVDAQGCERTRKRPQRRELETIFGTVEVMRSGYGAAGEASLHPVDAQLNLPAERYSLEVRRRAALEASKGSFEEAVQTLKRYTGATIGKRKVEELAVRAAQDFDAFYEQRRQGGTDQGSAEQAETAAATAAADAAEVLVISIDGKGVVMHREDLRPATRRASKRKPGNKMSTRLSKGEKRNRKRMASVATVYEVAPVVRTPQQMLALLARDEEADAQAARRPRPQRKRVWASLEQEPRAVLEEGFREALERDPQRQRRWAAVVDGNETQLRIVTELAARHEVKLTLVLDIFHVLEYLWKAGHALATEGSEALEQWVLQRLGRVLEGGAAPAAAGMRRSATRRRLTAGQREPVDQCADYLRKHRSYLAYDQYLGAGLPIGSGVIEGACRHLVKEAGHHRGALAAAWCGSGAAPASAPQQRRF